MEVSRIRILRGPNLWSRHTAIEAIVSCEDAEQNIKALADFENRLRARFPQIGPLCHTNNQSSVSIAHVLALATLRLQAVAGCPVTFCDATQTTEQGIYQVVAEYSEEEVGELALELAQALCRSALEDTSFDLTDALTRLQLLDEDVRLGPSTGAIAQAAQVRGIPYRRLTAGSTVQFGWGCKQRRIQAAEIDSTSAVAESIAQDKELTKELLRAAGVPVPQGRPVYSPEDAWAAACEIGGYVVVKPRDGNQGRGVAVRIRTREEVMAAYSAAAEVRPDVIVERYIPGHDYRLLVVGNQLVAAARREPPQVIGDGTHSIRELVDIVNDDPRRSDGHATALTKIRFDELALATLAKQSYTADSIPDNGVRVVLRNNANLSTGGSATDVTDDVHPELAARAIEAAKMIGIDICGIDVVCETMTKPLEEQSGGVVEANAAPGLRMHLQPSFGKGRNVGEAVMTTLFADGDDGRIPVVAVAGTNGKTTTVRLTAHILASQGKCVGMTNSDGVYVGTERIDTGDCSGPRSARNILMHPHVQAAVFETARGGILREGLAFDRCDVAIITNIGMGDHLGLNYINTVEDLSVVKRVVVQNVAPHGHAVLNAADPMVTDMASACQGKIIFFAADRANPTLMAHAAKGERTVFVEAGHIIATQGTEENGRIALQNIPLTRNGTLAFQVENAMSAIAAAWALGIDWQDIERGVASFINDAQSAPGRFNMFDYKGATVIADYGHNPDAILALVAAIQNIPAKRRIAVISGAGDRRDEDIRRQTQILGEAFDEVILYQDQCQRGRADGEVLRLLQEGLINATRTQQIEEIRGEFLATDRALEKLQSGDLCLILIDQVDEALEHITQRVAQK